MSRRAKFSQALVSGYLTIGVNTLYTLLSIPLALSYLPTREFGLWALAAQLAVYLGLIETCLAGSISRLLVEYKDDRAGYGRTVKTGFVVVVSQGLLAGLIGLALTPWMADWLEIPADLADAFTWLYASQCALFGISCALKMFHHLLIAHQRQDLINHAQTVSFVGMFVVQWLTFRWGQGVFSLLWATIAGTVLGGGIVIWSAVHCRVLPERGQWGTFCWPQFREIFSFGGGLFLLVLGSQLIGASQIIIVKLCLGLEAAGIFAVCTKTFVLAQQLIFRVFDFSVAALSEMAARGELERLRKRFLELTTISGVLAAWGGMTLAACNDSFIHWWTQGRVSWPAWNNWLFGALLFAYTINRVHGGLAWIIKETRYIRWIYPLEGAFFVTAGAFATFYFGIPGLVLVAIAGNFLFSGLFGAQASFRGAGIRPRDYFSAAMSRPLPTLVAFAAGAAWWAHLWKHLAPLPQLGMLIAGLVPIGGLLAWLALPDNLKRELSQVVAHFPLWRWIR